jgi:hypothetical protein
MPVLGRLAIAPTLFEPVSDPRFEILDAFTADAQFENVQSHEGKLTSGDASFNAARGFAQLRYLTAK